MMKKNVLLILIVILLTTGCTANYTLKYEDGTFTETVEVTGDKEDDAHPTYQTIKDSGLYADIEGDEKFELDPSSTRYDVKISHVLQNDTLEDLKATTECFRLANYYETDETYYLSLYGGFTCPHLENSTFTLETDNTVVSHNATRVDGNIYIWDLTEDAVGDDGITFQIIKNDVKKASIKSDTVTPTWLKVLLVILLVGSGFAMVIMLKRINER